ncbi:hypothetical protein BJG92_00887 [Arthrobacter sp. SO5]|nr:hypothetical protein [Arthrobacter sp. SO5]MCB5273367.1 hypothetical protein [Arthrobacter sp. SO5]
MTETLAPPFAVAAATTRQPDVMKGCARLAIHGEAVSDTVHTYSTERMS